MTDVLLDVRALQSGHGLRGIGTYVRTLLANFSYAGHVLWAGVEQPGEAAGEAVLVPGSPSGGRTGWCRDLSRSSIRLRRELSPIHFPTLDAALGRAPSAVVTVHDAIPWRFPELYPAGRFGRVRHEVEAAVARHTSRVVTGSHAAAHDLERYLRISPRRIEVLPYSYDPGFDTTTEKVAQVRDQLGLADRFIVVAGGFRHVDPRKRIEDVVAALASLPDDVGLVVTGEHGPHSAALLATAHALGVGHRVVLTGHLPVAEMAALFGAATVFAFPSAWEGFGIPLVNAMRAGVPAVISNGGALPEVAAGAALVHPVGDVAALASLLRSVLEDAALAASLRLGGRERSAAFRPEVMVDGYARMYENL